MRTTEPGVALTFPARALLAGAGGLAVLAGPILFLFPDRTDAYFAWDIQQPLTPVFMGASYMAGISNVWALRENRWSLARVQVPAMFVFGVTQLVATLLHLSIFNWSHPVAWAWLFVYIISPIGAGAVWIQMEARFRSKAGAGQQEADRQGRPLPRWLRPAMTAFAIWSTLLALALFLAPNAVADEWPWSLTPLTSRVIGGWYLAAASLQLMLERQRVLEHARVALLANIVVTSLLLVGAALHASAFEGPALSVAVYLLTTGALGAVSAGAWVQSTRAIPKASSQSDHAT